MRRRGLEEATDRRSVAQQMRLKKGWLFLLALALQHFAVTEQWYMSPAYPLMVGASYALLIWGAVINLHHPGFRFLLAGTLLNLAPLAIHGWYMPVTPETLSAAGFSHEATLSNGTYLVGSKSILLARGDTSLWMFTDVIPVSWPIRMVFSPGDLLVLLGLCLLLIDVVRAFPHQRPGTELRPE